MSAGGLIFAVVTLLVALAWIGLPYWRGGARRESGDESLAMQRERLSVYYERMLTNIRDLDEDHATGKMPDVDYSREREEWVQRGIQALRALDKLDEQQGIVLGADAESIDRALESDIEAAIAAYRARAKST
jgi:hypothetical protein